MVDKSKILVVDDDSSVRKLLACTLQAHNYEVFEAEDGNTALQMCKQQKPNLILLDINLPDILGVDIADKIISSEQDYGKPKIIIITGMAYSLDNPKERWQQEYGVADFIEKPFDLEAVLFKVQQTIES